jgi:hypothetical protein
MSSDLMAWIVAITLGLAVVGLGLRRYLADITRNWLPRFGEPRSRRLRHRGHPMVDKGVVSFPHGKGSASFGPIC